MKHNNESHNNESHTHRLLPQGSGRPFVLLLLGKFPLYIGWYGQSLDKPVGVSIYTQSNSFMQNGVRDRKKIRAKSQTFPI